jgi:hypothetical protein
MEGSKVDSFDGALDGRSVPPDLSKSPLGLEISKRYWLETGIAKPSARILVASAQESSFVVEGVEMIKI